MNRQKHSCVKFYHPFRHTHPSGQLSGEAGRLKVLMELQLRLNSYEILQILQSSSDSSYCCVYIWDLCPTENLIFMQYNGFLNL